MHRTFFALFSVLAIVGTLLAGCGAYPSVAPGAQPRTLVIMSVTNQTPEKLQLMFSKLTPYLSAELGVPVEYRPMADYAAVVNAFKAGDADLVSFGGLTGVQATVQLPGAQAIVQRDIDQHFHSLFIANKATNITTLQDLKGHTFTFGGELSTSGRLMPQYYLQQAGIQLTDFKGAVGFSGAHDKTISLVQAGTYDAGAVNELVWNQEVKQGIVDLTKVGVLYTTPAFPDDHWVIHPDAAARFGPGFTARVQDAFLKLDPAVPAHKEILDLFGAQKFVATRNENYSSIESVARTIGILVP
jgi:phosphonate transport system substrate-binding protein